MTSISDAHEHLKEIYEIHTGSAWNPKGKLLINVRILEDIFWTYKDFVDEGLN